MTLNTARVPTVDTAFPSKYLDILEWAWARHLEPRAENAPTVISTFAGAGGSSLGYSIAGYHERLAVEWDNNAVETFKLNFPGVPVYHGDIAQLSVEQCLEMSGLQVGELDVFDGSPPCQGFSTAGKRIMDDPRNQLFREYIRLLRGLQPKVFVMENVSGMVKGKMKLIFVEILRELKASGYQVSARLMNAKYFHVPQSRERMIFIGVRSDLEIAPSHPRGQGRSISTSKAIENLEIDLNERQMLLDAAQKYVAYKEWHLVAPGKSLASVTGKNGFSASKYHPDKPARTIQKNDGNITMHGAMHWIERRRFTVSEFKRFASFPNAFCFVGTWGNAVNRIGNSVPPLFMYHISKHIRERILDQRK